MKLEKYMTVIVKAAFAAANASATLFNTIVDQWATAKDDGVKPADFREALIAALTDENSPHVTTHYSNRTGVERAAYSRNTVVGYLRKIDEVAFAQRKSAKRPKANKAAKGNKPATETGSSGYTIGMILDAAKTAGITKEQVTALFNALNA